jgi:hypothetical protein
MEGIPTGVPEDKSLVDPRKKTKKTRSLVDPPKNEKTKKLVAHPKEVELAHRPIEEDLIEFSENEDLIDPLKEEKKRKRTKRLVPHPEKDGIVIEVSDDEVSIDGVDEEGIPTNFHESLRFYLKKTRKD